MLRLGMPMKHSSASCRLLAMVWVGVMLLASACSAVPYGYAHNRDGRASAARMCESMRSFARASLDAEGLRRAWFLPFGSVGDGSVDFYAPMAANPSDESSRAFYEHGAGQLTHYVEAPEVAAALASCLSSRQGYSRTCSSQSKKTFRASFRDARSGRSIEISAVDDIATVLIAGPTWKGDVEQALSFDPNAERSAGKASQPTCKNETGG